LLSRTFLPAPSISATAAIAAAPVYAAERRRAYQVL
jgi:hypothetical protein